ncbi:cystatin-9-like isoform X2 [Odocoileus virginianus]|uniref:Cystatin-9-like isoform X2 n=1 Tax=Odocoileus virginianus TaxID=9874 RepID=A0A6J0WG07_ODOVR
MGRVKPGCLGAAAMTDWQRRCRWAQPWTLLLLLLGPWLLVSHSWGPAEKEGDDDQRFLKNYPPATVEYALHMYNWTSQGRNTYKEVDVSLVFSMELQFARIRCGTFDEDINNCPFQATPDVNNRSVAGRGSISMAEWSSCPCPELDGWKLSPPALLLLLQETRQD